MISKLRNSQLSRVISVTLVYALLLNMMIPSVQAMHLISFQPTVKLRVGLYQLMTKSNSEVIESIESISTTGTFERAASSRALPGLPSSGPGQTETGGYTIGSTDGMVNKFTGDFSYSIPLMNVEGYPVVLSYNSNVTMLQEASWVGLGWDLNIGSVSREMRGIPDEFNGEQSISRLHNELTSETSGKKQGAFVAASGGTGNESGANISGGGQLTLLFGNYTDNHLGEGRTMDFGLGGQFSIHGSGESGLFYGINSNLGFNYDSKNGLGYSSTMGMSGGISKNEGLNVEGSVSYGQSFNSRYGTNQGSLSFGASAGYTWKKDPSSANSAQKLSNNIGVAYSTSSTITYGTATTIPRITFNTSLGDSYNEEFKGYLKIKNGSSSAFTIGYIEQNYTSISELDILGTNNLLFQPAFGYMHSGKRLTNGIVDDFAIMDFNRSTDNEFSEEMKSLPFSIQTHDIFYASGAGVGGTFRPMRGDFGTYYDPVTHSMMNPNSQLLSGYDQFNFSLGLVYDVQEPTGIGIGIGADFGTMKNSMESGNWADQGSALHVLNFDNEATSNNFDASVYFKAIGERTPMSIDPYTATGGPNPDYYDVNDTGGGTIVQTPYLKILQTTLAGATLNSTVTKRTAATVFKPIIAADMNTGNDTYESMPPIGVSGSPVEIDRVDGSLRLGNHISAVDLTTPAGVRYHYGIPAYNYFTQEVSFSAGPNSSGAELSINASEGLVSYSAGVDNTIDNERGRGHYFDKTEVPAYAHSFLLTELTSSDYIDVGLDGLTLDDQGGWHKFNYSRIYGDENPFKWRFPLTANPLAKLSRGVLGSKLDDMANYSYGEKEIWYVQSIESKNYIAVFQLGDRLDMYSAVSEDGDLDEESPLKKLDKIILYSQSEWLRFKSNPSYTPLPIQTVEFVYNYSLCENSPGNFLNDSYASGGEGSGKLTLKEIRVSGGTSKEMATSRFHFDYGEENALLNPDFSYNAVDGWGNYKPYDADRPNDISPYSEQDETLANQYAQAWKLRSIETPAGGSIEIAYEADEYETVQYKRAMRHFSMHGMVDIFEFLKVMGSGSFNGTLPFPFNYHREFGDLDGFFSEMSMSPTSPQEADIKDALIDKPDGLYTQKFGEWDLNAVPQNVLVFRLEDDLSTSTYPTFAAANEKVRNDYFLDPFGGPNNFISTLFVKTHVNIKDGVPELVPMTVDISDDYIDAFADVFNGVSGGFSDDFNGFGVMPPNPSTNKYEYGYVIVDPVNTGDREEISGDGKDQVEKGSLTINPLQLMSLQFARQYLLDIVYGSCNGCDPNLSIDWKVLFGQDMYEVMIKDADYAQTMVNSGGEASPMNTVRLFEPDQQKFGGNARVASITMRDNWDDISGEYESSYQWRYDYDEIDGARPKTTGVASFESRVAEDENSLYNWISYVNIKNKFPDERKFATDPIGEQLFPIPVVGYRNVKVNFLGDNNYGHSESKYHTSKEFKYRTVDRSTVLDDDTRKIGLNEEIYGFTQGHLVSTNDFHGQPDEFLIIDNKGDLISRTSYEYYGLGEVIPMVDRHGNITPESVATEVDIHADARFIRDKNKFNMVGLNFEFFYVAPASFSFDFSPNLATSKRERSFYAHTLIKHINQSAVVKSITTEYLGSINRAENLLFDMYTGEPVVTSLTDEFNDQLYNTSYPAHWVYRELQELNETVGYSENVALASNGSFVPASGSMIAPGDRVTFNGTQNLWVAQEFPVPDDGSLFIISTSGAQVNPGAGTYSLLITTSARQNRLLEPVQQVITKSNPIVGSTLTTPDGIISASAIRLRDRLNVACGDPCEKGHGNNNELTFDALYNPYLYGIRGKLVLDGSYNWQDSRENFAAVHGIRYDGTYSSYAPFYEYSSIQARWLSVDNPDQPSYSTGDPLQKWRKMGDITTIDRYGKALDTKDQLGIQSAVLFGYNSRYNLVPIAQAINAQQSDIAFDGFEDYNYLDVPYDNACEFTESHFDFLEVIDLPAGIYVTNAERHSGLASLQIPPGEPVGVSKKVALETTCHATDALDGGPDDFMLDEPCVCIKPFEPSPGDYILGAWMKATSQTDARINVQITTPSGLTNNYVTASGPVLDGWRRMEGEFNIPSDATDIQVLLENQTSSDNVYFDDIRIHPFLSGMTTTVYDPRTLLPLATHDGYNFTTFYNYDENLNPVRMRVETVDGIKTISETESGGQKDF